MADFQNQTKKKSKGHVSKTKYNKKNKKKLSFLWY